jgi:hypothetical protein
MTPMKRLLIAGYGDIARRTMALLGSRYEVRAVSRAQGMDLDGLAALSRSARRRGAALRASLRFRRNRYPHCQPAYQLDSKWILPTRVVYISTSGVYGDCGGALVDELRAPNPKSDRAVRRLSAEAQLAVWCKKHRVALVVLRAPGIYASDRLPLERLHAGTPVLRDEDDVYTNHIHADDLAGICVRALQEDAPREPTMRRTIRSSRWAPGSIWSPTAPGCRGRYALRAPTPPDECRRSCFLL